MSITLYIAASLDMKIADPEGSVAFLSWVEELENEDYRYHEFYDSISTVVMGRKTYDISLELGKGEYPYTGKTSYVFSKQQHVQQQEENSIQVIHDIDEFEEMDTFDQQVWFVGGGDLLTKFLERDIVDKFVITVFPVILGKGIELFPEGISTTTLHLAESKSYDNGLVQLTYIR